MLVTLVHTCLCKTKFDTVRQQPVDKVTQALHNRCLSCYELMLQSTLTHLYEWQFLEVELFAEEDDYNNLHYD